MVSIEDVMKETKFDGLRCAVALGLMKGAGLVDWSFYHADPWWSSSNGHIAAQGYQVVYEMRPRVRARMLLGPFLVSLTSGAIPTLLAAWVNLPGIQQALAGLLGGTIGGTTFSYLTNLRRPLFPL